jgi:two-component system LytT family response regulator
MQNEITAILVDDEIKALSMLGSKLNELFPQIRILEKINDPAKAIKKINELKPQLLFLDINMPNYNGFELLQHIYDPIFEIVFVTAYDNYALDAIKHAAAGYVLKPISDDLLYEATRKALDNAHQRTQSFRNNIDRPISKISIPFNNGIALKSIGEIIRLEGFDGYTRIFLANETMISSYNIGLFNKMLIYSNFRMVHKSHLVNMGYVDKYLNEGTLVLSNGDKVPVSRSNKAEILNFFKNNY